FKGPHLLILDEPANHLDIDSRAALIEAINDYRGAVILVSHDKHLLDACADRLWLVEAGTVKPFDGDIDDYNEYVLAPAGGGNGRQMKQDRGEARRADPDPGENPRHARNAARLDKRITAIEANMRKFHDLISRIDTALGEPAVFVEDPAKAALLSSQRGELERILVAAEEEWLRLAGDLDDVARGKDSPRGPAPKN
ncbi:MAG: ABC transporter ATP-binding protein, partial [Methylocella sp.]